MHHEAFIFWNPWWTGEKDWLQAQDRTGLPLLKQLFSRKEILTISGVRRSGKTTFLHLLIDLLLQAGVLPGNILQINLEDPAFKGFSLFDLYEQYLEFQNPSGKIYLFLDEIQELEDWQRALRKLYDGVRGLKIVVTGSNSSLLKGDYATLLTGRTIPYEVYPYSFKEMVAARGLITDFNAPTLLSRKAKLRRAFNEYLQYGGFPEVVNEEKSNLKMALLKEYYNGILTRDVLRRHAIRRTKQYEKATHFLMSNVTTSFSIKNLSGILDVNPHTLEEYIGYLEDVYLLFSLNHFSYSLKTQVTYPRKAYCVDNGFISAVSFKFSADLGKALENAVFVRLKSSGQECYYWKGKKECDFIVKEGNTVTEALQVSYSLKDQGTRKREMEGLLEALKEFHLERGTILTYDETESITGEGKEIEVVPLWLWLLKRTT